MPSTGESVTVTLPFLKDDQKSVKFEILQDSSTVSTVDISPTPGDQGKKRFIFQAPPFPGTFDLAVSGGHTSTGALIVTPAHPSAPTESSPPGPTPEPTGQASSNPSSNSTSPASGATLFSSSETTRSSILSSLTLPPNESGSPNNSSPQSPFVPPSYPLVRPSALSFNPGSSQSTFSTGQEGTTSSKSSNSNMGAIVGGVVGGVFFLLLLTAALCLWRRRARVESPSTSTMFQRELMVRSKSDSPSAQVKDSQVFQFGASEKVSPSRRTSSSSIDDADEKTPSLVKYTSSPTKREPTRPTSPTATSIYTDYTQSTEVQYDSVVPRIPARTDRQMEIQERIMDLRGQMIGMVGAGNAGDLSRIREKIKKLEEAQNSDWALEISDVPPSGLEGVLQSERIVKASRI
ncbi:hypothetical protein VKT23_018672 [Stygiomarasmius scandens]|uniref:Uncharacterized protein n=1 Tax=Marasmiellus scandens TaxID=2682957 RepID=A0ABR1INC1_9AGAR